MPYWERDDDFDITPPYGSRLQGYFRARPASTHTIGNLADFDGDGVPHASRSGGLGSDGDPMLFVWRNLQVQDCSARVSGYVASTLPVFGASQITQLGVAARLTGGTSSTSPIYINQPDFYLFKVVGNLGAQTVTFSITRWNGGTETTLSTSGAIAVDNIIDGFKPLTLRLDVWDDSGDVKLVGYIENFQTAGGPSPITEFALLGSSAIPITDSSADKLTGSGRCGVYLGDDEDNTTFPGLPFYRRMKCSAFRVFNYSSSTGVGTKRHDEDWVRLTPQVGENVSDKQSNSAKSVLFSFGAGDLWCQSDSPLFDSGSASNVIEYAKSGNPSDRGFCLWQAPAESSIIHRPQIDLRWTTFGLLSYARYGLIAKGSGANLDGGNWIGARGYMLLADRQNTQLQIWRASGSDLEPDFLASVAFTPTLNTWYELRLVVQPVTEGVNDGPQLIECWLDGTKQTLVVESTFASQGITADAGGGIVDASSDRITIAQGEGIATWPGVGLTEDVIEFRDWTQASATVDPPAEDQGGIDFDDESSGSLPTLDTYTALLASPIASEQGYYVGRSRFESGHTLARALMRDKRRRWPDLRTVPLTTSQRDDLLAFWQARSGSVDPFLWTSPEDEVEYTVHFIDGTLELEELFRDVWVVTFGLEQIR